MIPLCFVWNLEHFKRFAFLSSECRKVKRSRIARFISTKRQTFVGIMGGPRVETRQEQNYFLANICFGENMHARTVGVQIFVRFLKFSHTK